MEKNRTWGKRKKTYAKSTEGLLRITEGEQTATAYRTYRMRQTDLQPAGVFSYDRFCYPHSACHIQGMHQTDCDSHTYKGHDECMQQHIRHEIVCPCSEQVQMTFQCCQNEVRGQGQDAPGHGLFQVALSAGSPDFLIRTGRHLSVYNHKNIGFKGTGQGLQHVQIRLTPACFP